MPDSIVFLIGARASGKTTVGRALAERLGREFVDTDELVVREVGLSITELVARSGWEPFRERETAVLTGLCGKKQLVVATGGGMVLRPENRDLMRAHGFVVYLEADASTLARRLESNPLPGQRPSLSDRPLEEEVRQVLAERDALYRACAHLVLPAEFTVPRLLAMLGEMVDCKA